MNRQPRILAVDDDVSSAELVVRVAERCGFEGFATSDSRGVINLANALEPDIIAVDICMPNIDATELFHILAGAKYGGEVLVVSGQENSVLEKTRQRAVEIGISVRGILQKPLNFHALREMLMRGAQTVSAA